MADEAARLKLVFRQIDRDGDGKIDAKDLFQTMVALGRKVTQVIYSVFVYPFVSKI